MRKYIFILLISIFSLFANTTNEEILKKLDKIEHNQELIRQEMKLRFEAIDKRFEAVDKRFEMMNENMNKRFEAIDKHFEMMNENFNKRFEAIDKRFEMMNENMNKRFEAIDKRFEDMNRRFEILTNFILALTAGIFGLIGFMMWDRRTVVEKAKREMENSDLFNKKADREYVEKLIKAMNELLAKDEMAKEVFKKYGII
ncbi:MAG: hypothetical protein ABGX25_05060 [Nautiliaceae bacterium]